MAVKDGKIISVGSTKEINEKYHSDNSVDAKGKFIYPGFIDAHAHFFLYGNGLQEANLVDTKNWNEVLQRLQAFKNEKKIQANKWIVGRGWDQNDWPGKTYPDKQQLDAIFPDNPVLLFRVDGHAAIANTKAMREAKLDPATRVAGGEIELKNGQPTGIFIDNAINIINSSIPRNDRGNQRQALLDAQANCFAAGLTTVDDCGVYPEGVEMVEKLQKEGALKMRLYMLLPDHPYSYSFFEKRGIIKTDRLHVRGIKLYMDGALGSRGACLLHSYADRQGWNGFLTSTPAHMDSMAAFIYAKGLQMCTHAIGDSGNRVILNIYAKHLKGKNDLRWRVEHAQVVNENDFNLFGKYSIIPSVQPTHATSDMYWAGARLGKEREKGAYAFRQLMQQNQWIPLGTDFPVEDISPFKTFASAVFRQDSAAFPKGGYQIENALSPQDAIRGMTIWAARANFEEKEKGSLEPGKFADFIILDRDLLSADLQSSLQTKVLATFVGGEKVYEKK
jgi:predicted amidohydrolase YtcJ